MSDVTMLAICLVLSFLMGSIPFGLLVAKAKGVDIRKQGSGNIGATNVSRALGKKWGILVFFLDALKGALGVLLVKFCFLNGMEMEQEWWVVGALLAAVLGHNFCPWLGFKGGKGIATSAGGLLAMLPKVSLLCFLLWLILFKVSRYMVVASLGAAVVLPVAIGYLHGWKSVYFVLGLVLLILALYRHKDNILRLRKGKELRF